MSNLLAPISTTQVVMVEQVLPTLGTTAQQRNTLLVVVVAADRLALLGQQGANASHRFIQAMKMLPITGMAISAALVESLALREMATAVQPDQQAPMATRSPAIQISPTPRPGRLQE